MDIHIHQHGQHGSVTVYPSLPIDVPEIDEGVTQESIAVFNETAQDEIKAAFFKQGWDAATREAMLNFVNGRLVEYFQELGHDPQAGQAVPTTSEDPHHNEPAGTGEALDIDTNGIYQRDPDFEDNWTQAEWEGREDVLERIHPVVDSGEPLVEAEDVSEDIPGTWTMSNEELNSRINEAYSRGVKDGKAESAWNQTTARTLERIADETTTVLLRDWPEGIDQTKREFGRRFALAIAVRFGWQVNA